MGNRKRRVGVGRHEFHEDRPARPVVVRAVVATGFQKGIERRRPGVFRDEQVDPAIRKRDGGSYNGAPSQRDDKGAGDLTGFPGRSALGGDPHGSFGLVIVP